MASGHLSKHRAHQASYNHAERVCFHIDSCVTYGVVKCDRVNKGTVDCKEIEEFNDGFIDVPRKSTCTQWAEWKLIQNRLSGSSRSRAATRAGPSSGELAAA